MQSTVDLHTAIVNALTQVTPELITVGAAGLGVAIVTWGFPKALQFFKKTAK